MSACLRYLCGLCCLFLALRTEAQVVIYPKPIPEKTIGYDDILSNITIYSGLTATIPGEVTVRVLSAGGQELILFRSEIVHLRPGVNQLHIRQSLRTVQYSGSSSFNNFARQQQGLPYGQYEICYSFYGVAEQVVLDERCESNRSVPLVPVQIESPAAGAVLDECQVLLTWSPPMPAGGDLTYRVRIVELDGARSAMAALAQRPAVADITQLRGHSYAIGTHLPGLRNKQLYAWEVIAYRDGEPVSSGEPGTFSFDCGGDVSGLMMAPADTYVQMQPWFANCYHASGSTLRLLYVHKSGHASVPYRIVRVDTTPNTVISTGTFTVQFGANLIDHSIAALVTNGVYHIVVRDHHQDEYGLEFRKI